MAGGSSHAVVCAAAHLKGVKAAAYARSGFWWMLCLGRWVRGNPFLFSLPSPALEVSRPIVHLLGFRASPKIPTSDAGLRQAFKFSFKIVRFSFKMAGFSFKMVDFSLKSASRCEACPCEACPCQACRWRACRWRAFPAWGFPAWGFRTPGLGYLRSS